MFDILKLCELATKLSSYYSFSYDRKEVGEDYLDETRTEKESIYCCWYSEDGRRSECQKWLETHQMEKGTRLYNNNETSKRGLDESFGKER